MSIKKHFSNILKDLEYNTIFPRSKITFNKYEKEFLTETIQCSAQIKHGKEAGIIQKEVFLCKLKKIKFYGWTGAIAQKKLPIIESTLDIHRFYRMQSIDLFFFRKRKLEGTYASVMPGISGENNYYHFIIESIPRLYSLSKIKEDNINLIISKNMDRKFLNILKIFIDDRYNLFPIPKYETWKIKNYYFPSFWNKYCSGYLPKFMIEYIKNNILNTYNIKDKLPRKRLYISRKFADKRKLKNEEEFYNLLKKYNFERIFSENLSHEKQVEYFFSAEIITGVHGAGLTNIIFSENCKVLELFPPQNIKTNYFMLSKAVNLEYYYLVGYDQTKSDFRVDITKAEKIIVKIINDIT